MNILEKDLEEIIHNSSSEELYERGLYLSGKSIRQLRIGGYGISDLIFYRREYFFDYNDRGVFGMTSTLIITVCELKKEKAGISAFLQAVRYTKGIKSYLDKRGFKNYKLEIVLIAKEIDNSSDYIFLTDIIKSESLRFVNDISNYSVKYCLNGLSFNLERGYKLINEKF
jgi:hypothetical protein